MSGQQTLVAISLSNLPAETIVPMVNVVASAYSQACRAEWKLHAEQAYSAAQAKVRQTERQAFEAQTRFELLRDRRLRALASLRPVAPPQPATIENPRWTEANRRLADLEERRRVLLFERTPLHPSVQEIEMRITDARREMASIPPKISQDHRRPRAPTTQRRAARHARLPRKSRRPSRRLSKLKQDLQQAQAMERAALTARGEELQVDLLAAEPLPPPACAARANTAILGKALVIAATSIVGLGMISFGGLAGAGAIEHRRIAGPLARAHRGRDSGHASRPPLHAHRPFAGVLPAGVG